MPRSNSLMSAPLLSLIFVNYQSSSFLMKAIDSWRKPLKDIPFEVIIVNNDVEEQAQIAELARQEGVRVEQMGYNSGFGAASNRGAAIARGTWFFFLNPDTQYASGDGSSLLPIFAAYPRSFGGIKLQTPAGVTEAWSSGQFPTFGTLVGNHLWGALKRVSWERPTFTEIDWVSGAALLASRAAFEELGGFDEKYFLYFEDVDLAKRARKREIPVWYSPTLTVQHVGGGSHADHRVQKQSYYQSEQLYFEKYRPTWEKICLRYIQQLFFS
ncbi:glycosyltransferase [Candidatus Dojkabacteria bacterium]|uniref:Glycosyltransferase n=1 Tax=Candidatus Dojkabacteria bacterium TaxID=2099670 RepID=A0A5C7J7M1_9BACT|nr:MAG: glycosyltransferase [Candidatus Dojkabacteria bacterium]